jgi:hypothetical protein
MKNRIAIAILAAALVGPQAALWADETNAGGTAAPSTTGTSNTQTPKTGHKKHHKHHKKTQTSATSNAPNTTGAPTTPAGN